MKTLLNTYDVANALAKDEYANWSQNGALALAEYLEEYEESTGEELELDPVAIRCEFSEYESVNEAAARYTGEFAGLSYTNEAGALEYLRDHTSVITFDGGVIIQDF
jgi:hypothetical protein